MTRVLSRGVLAVLGLTAAAWLTTACERRSAPPGVAEPAIPSPDTAPMQPRVAQRVQEARNAVARSPQSAEGWGTLGAVCDAHDLLDCAAVAYARAMELGAADFRWPYLLAQVRERLGAEASAVTELHERAARLAPKFPIAQFRLGDALLRQGRLVEAQAAYARALDGDPRLALAHLGIAQALLARNEPGPALEALERALEIGGEDPRIFTAMARARHLTGDAAGAAEADNRARTVRREIGLPDPVRSYVEQLGVSSTHLYARANRLLAAGRFGEAIPLLDAVAEFRPNPSVYHRLAVAHERTGQPDRAIDYLAKALAQDPDHRRANQALGSLLAARGDHEQAAEHLRRAAKPRPERQEPSLAAVREAIERGGFEEARALLARAGRAAEGPEADYLRGRILEHESRFAEAVEHYRRAAERAAAGGTEDDAEDESAGGASAASVP